MESRRGPQGRLGLRASGSHVERAIDGLERLHPIAIRDAGALRRVLEEAAREGVELRQGMNRRIVPELARILRVEAKGLVLRTWNFEPGRDEIVRDGTAGFVVSFGETLYRALDAVERLKEKGIDVGLVNKPTLNVVDEEMMARIGSTGFVLVAEGLSSTTGLGSRFGTWLLERGLHPRFAHIGTHREGCGGLWEQMVYQGLDPEGIMAGVEKLVS